MRGLLSSGRLAAGLLAVGLPCGGPAAAAQPAAVRPAAASAPQNAATLYALNCMGCHPPPRTPGADRGPLRGEFYLNARGRNFYIRVPQDGKRVLGPDEEARLFDEIMTWKRSCSAILQDAPQVNYGGERFVK
ncbi:MAG: hypothetical protein KF786_03010 [Burkholderiaceae bacterium]|nr:hypothetical protein [Burkholderiaceae bacterium]